MSDPKVASTVKIFDVWGSLLGEWPGENIREALENAVRSGASLVGASLVGASLVGASLDRARLDRASLVGASLDGASLVGASLVGASLVGASLDRARLDRARLVGARLVGASLVGASLDRASLVGASLDRASLDGASLVGASLDRARLDRASLDRARLPSPGVVLLAWWGELSDATTLALMRLDASAHPDPEAFDRWAAGGDCPYTGVLVQRAAYFKEKKSLWSPGSPPTLWEALCLVLDEKCPGWRGEGVARG